MSDCIFCKIVSGQAPASIILKDEHCIAFMNIRPIRPGEFMVIPRTHLDHFTDMPDALATHILLLAQRLARAVQAEFKPLRMGYVVHGFGVGHAHLNVVPMHDHNDIISGRHVSVVDGNVRISEEALNQSPRLELDQQADKIRALSKSVPDNHLGIRKNS